MIPPMRMRMIIIRKASDWINMGNPEVFRLCRKYYPKIKFAPKRNSTAIGAFVNSPFLYNHLILFNEENGFVCY